MKYANFRSSTGKSLQYYTDFVKSKATEGAIK